MRRKTISVLCIDALTTDRDGDASDPDLDRVHFQAYLDRVRRIVAENGGSFRTGPGYMVFALFGIPTLQPDDALRCVAAGLELRHLHDESNDFGARCGASTGEVVVDDDDTDPSVTGIITSIAQIMALAAQAGELLIDGATSASLGAVVEGEATTARSGDGRLLQATRVDRILRASPRPEISFVARQQELATLVHAFDEVVRDDEAQRVTLIGSPGVGKSRLAREALQQLRSRALTATAHCVPHRQDSALEPLADLVRAILGPAPEDGSEALVAQVRKALGSIADAEVVVTQIAQLLGATPERSSVDASVSGARRLFEALAQRMPLILLVEDVHWAGAILLDAIEHITRALARAPVLILCSARQELVEARPEWVTDGRSNSALSLSAMSPTDVETILSRLLGETVPPEIRREIATTAQGNPLFTEVIVASLLDRGILHLDGSRWALDETAGEIVMPSDVRKVLSSRIDTLSAVEREAIAAAAVAGERFTTDAVDGNRGDDGETTASILMRLVRKDLIDPAPSDVPGDEGYRFRHALVRDVAYASTSKETRARLHTRRAEILEAAGSSPDALGYHYEQAALCAGAVDPTGTWVVELSTLGARHLAEAGRVALERSDATTAWDRLERAARLANNHDPLRATIEIDLAEALAESGEIPRARAMLDGVIATATRLGDASLEGRARVESAMTGIYLREISLETAVSVADRFIPLFESRSDDLALARAHQVIAEAHWDALQESATERTLERALTHARRAGSRREMAKILSWLSSAAFWGPTPVVRALERCTEILDLSEADPRVHASVMLNVAGLHAMRKNFTDARELARRSKLMMEDLGLPVRAAGSTHQAGMIEMMAGDYAAAEASFRFGYDTLGTLGEEGLKVTSATLLGRALYELDRIDEAEEMLRPFIANDDDIEKADWGPTFAKILARRGDLDRAETLARQASASATVTTQVRLQADVAFDLGEVLLMKGDRDDAILNFERSFRLYALKGDIASPDLRRRRLEELRVPIPT